jgi:hypothetical protein
MESARAASAFLLQRDGRTNPKHIAKRTQFALCFQQRLKMKAKFHPPPPHRYAT